MASIPVLFRSTSKRLITGLLQFPIMPRRRSNRSKSPWSDDLPRELLVVILLHLACLADRVYFGAVCHAWRSAARGVNAQLQQIPWLILPSPRKPSFFSLHSGAIRRLYLPWSVSSARLCGSHGSGWVTLAFDQWRGYAALNLLSGIRVPLPDRLRINLLNNYDHMAPTSCDYRMVIRTVTFSAAPTSEGCLAAAQVCSASNLAFWRLGMGEHWLAGRGVDGFQDIIYYGNQLKQGFHIITDKEEIMVFEPNSDRNAPLRMSHSSYQICNRADYIPDDVLPESNFVTRYLVESRGKLLMVMRQYTISFGQRRTGMIRIFEMKLGIVGSYDASWVELFTLPGQVLFLGRGCSKAIEVSQAERLQMGKINYLDDTTLDLSFLVNNSSKYTSTDMAVGSKETRTNSSGSRHFLDQCTTECSPPMWFFPI